MVVSSSLRNKLSGRQVVAMITLQLREVSNIHSLSSPTIVIHTTIIPQPNLNSKIVTYTIIPGSSNSYSRTAHPVGNSSSSTRLPSNKDSNNSSLLDSRQSRHSDKELNQVLTQDPPQASPPSNFISLQVAALKSASDESEISLITKELNNNYIKGHTISCTCNVISHCRHVDPKFVLLLDEASFSSLCL
jgi:hypothetical protein